MNGINTSHLAFRRTFFKARGADIRMQMTIPFTVDGMRRGFIAGQPFGVGVLVYGIAFGLLAVQIQFSLLEGTLMSVLVYSGSAQLAVVNGLPGGALSLSSSALLALLTTIFLLNARYLLYGAALRPWLGQVPAWQAYPTLAVLGDGNWVLSMKQSALGERDAGYILGSGLASFLPWIGGTVFGMLGGKLISNPKLLALDFMLVAFCAAMATSMVKGRADVAIVATAGLVALAADAVLPQGWSIVAAGLAGAALVWIRFKPEPAPETAP
jgi:predicted branched-subunit amino acid permease